MQLLRPNCAHSGADCYLATQVVLLFVALALLKPSAAAAEEFFIAPATDLKRVPKQVKAGDSIVLQNGKWVDADLKFEQLPGTSDAPIHIRAQTPGNVILTGATQFRFSGSYITVSGLVIRDPAGISDVIQFRTHSERHAHHCRVTDCSIEESPDSNEKMKSRWISIYGTNNRVDHCYIAGKKNRGTTLVVWVTQQPGNHRIDHNHFGPRPKLGSNGGETIRVGTSHVSEFDSKTSVENNYFHACDGEAEIVSNKSCGNVYRHNTFDTCSGALTLRHGHRCVVDGNVFFGRKQSGTGGVRIIGESHTVTNNYFEGLRGDAARAALCLMNGVPNSPLHEYAPVRNAEVAHNTFIDCKVSVEIGVGAGKKQSAAPEKCEFAHNVFVPGKWELFRIHSEPTGLSWVDNLLQPGSRNDTPFRESREAKLPMQRTDDGLLRPLGSDSFRATLPSTVPQDIDGFPRQHTIICGCDDPATKQRTLANEANTGPSWRKQTP